MNEKKRYCYSPHPMERYLLHGVKDDEVSAIMQLDRSVAVWNLFWLSVPGLDNLPGSGRRWHKVYKPVENALATIVTDVLEDEVLYRKLMMHPEQFYDWFEREDHTIFDCHEVLGGDIWVETVLTRAQAAIDRLIIQNPVVSFKDNVVKVNFRRAA